jgi:hypothetical protein
MRASVIMYSTVNNQPKAADYSAGGPVSFGGDGFGAAAGGGNTMTT